MVLFPRDVFICHASPDKEEYARPLERALGRQALSCWVDEGQIWPGDSLTTSLNSGLASTRFVSVLVTRRFMDKEPGWTEKELNAAFHREVRTGETVVVPILAISEDEWFERFPLLADKLYIPWALGPEGVAERIATRFERIPASDWFCDHPREHVGHVWIRVNASADHLGRDHSLVARWGPHIRTVDLPALGKDPVSLVHHKLNPDSIPLQVQVDPPAILTFGQGAPPDPPGINIDEGWTRMAGWNFPATGPAAQMR
jgi:hypothetical protein